MEYFINLVILFFIASFIGWCMEVIGKFFVFHRFINRGMLFGPWLPIYGSGAVLVTLLIGLIPGAGDSVAAVFDIAFFACGIVEYMVSFVMEKMFHARWWDYSKRPMNLNGRIWIGNLILFGIAGVVVIMFVNPVIFGFCDQIDLIIRETVAAILGVLFVTDFIFSQFVLKLVKVSAEKSEADNTEDVNREVRLILSDRSIFYRRFADAYPNVIYRTDKIVARMEEIRAETEKFKEEMEKLRDGVDGQIEAGIEASKAKITGGLEPVFRIKNTLIQKQRQLINLLYDESKATEDMKNLKDDIDNKFTLF